MKAKNETRIYPALFKSLLLLLILSLLFLSVDFFSKQLVHNNLVPGQSIPIIGDFFRITYVQNTMVAFGFLSQSNWYAFPMAIFGGGTILILVIVFQDVILHKVPPLKRLADYLASEIGSLDPDLQNEEDQQEQKPVTIHKVMFPLFIAALAGNVIDRFRYGYVVDFFDFGLFGFRWPSFNFADLYLMTTLILIVFGGLSQFIQVSEEESEEESSKLGTFISLEGLLIAFCVIMASLGFVVGRYEEFIKANIHLIQAFIAIIAIIMVIYFFITIEINNLSAEQTVEYRD